VGGGIIGLLSAYELRLAGEDVTVLDRQKVGKEASWAGGGILSPLYPWRYPEAVNRLAAWSQAHYPALATSLKQGSGIDPEWIRSGLMILDVNDAESSLNWCRTHGIVAERVDRTGLAELEPSLSTALAAAICLPDVAQIRNPRLLKSLVKQLLALGVTLKEHVTVSGFDVSGGVLAGIRTESGLIPAERCLIAAGSWSGPLLAGIGLDLPLRPVKGQMLALSGSAASFRHVLLKNGRYLIPRSDGRILVGSTQEEMGFDKSTTAEARDMLMAAAVELVPGLASWRVERHWAGLRPGSPTGVPFIGPHPEIRGLYVSTGHFRNGIVLGPASARLAVDLMLDRTPILDPDQFALLRC